MDHRIHQIPKHHALQIPSVQKNTVKQNEASFREILHEQQQLKVSKHANDRLNERNIQLNDQQWKVISDKVSEARNKGITDSLVVTSNAALLVSTKNNVVVTAMDRAEAKSKIFTNINGTILIDE